MSQTPYNWEERTCGAAIFSACLATVAGFQPATICKKIRPEDVSDFWCEIARQSLAATVERMVDGEDAIKAVTR